MDIFVLKQAEKELKDVPNSVKADIFALIEDLAAGMNLSMPISRPLPSIAKGLHELRLSGKAGEYRVFYVIRVGDAIYIIHVAHKKTQGLDKKTSEILKGRLRSLPP
jgi:phage-related protein